MLHVFENVRTTTSGTSSRTRSRARPVGELGVGLVDDDQPGRDVEQRPHHRRRPRRRPVGLFGEHRNVTAGWAAATARAGRVDVEREVGGPLALDDGGAGDAGDVGVQLVRRLERQHRAARARRTSAAASAAPRSSRWRRRPARARRRASRRSPRAARWPRGRGSGATRSTPAPAASSSRHAGRRRERRLVGVQPDLDVDLRRVVALERPQVVADGHGIGGRHHGWRRYWRGAIVGS